MRVIVIEETNSHNPEGHTRSHLLDYDYDYDYEHEHEGGQTKYATTEPIRAIRSQTTRIGRIMKGTPRV